MSLPLHRSPRHLYVVLLGGMLGTLARWCLAELLPGWHGWPVATLAANLAGAFCLGLVQEALLRHGPDEGWARLARLHLATGFLGAFTTMSTLAVESLLLFGQQRAGQALAYLLGSLVGGVLLAWAGVLAGARHRPRAAGGRA